MEAFHSLDDRSVYRWAGWLKLNVLFSVWRVFAWLLHWLVGRLPGSLAGWLVGGLASLLVG